MKIPQMPALQDQSKVYSPTSGVNLSKLPNEIDDGQNALMLNMWYRDTMLRIRPGLVKEIEQTYGRIIDVYPKDGSIVLLKRITKNDIVTVEMYGIYIMTAYAVLAFDGTAIDRIPSGATMAGLGGAITYTYDDLIFDFSNSKIISASSNDDTLLDSNLLNWKISGTTFYILNQTNNSEFWPYCLYEVSPQILIWPIPLGSQYAITNYFITSKSSHIPTIYTSCHASGAGDKLEARNYLTPFVNTEYRTDATSTVYHLPGGETNIDDEEVLINYYDLSGIHTIWPIIAGTTANTQGGVTATLNRSNGTVTFSSVLADATSAAAPNMTIQYQKTVYVQPNPILKCNIGSWFGGAYQGQTSGDSIFVAGNPDEPNAIYHSAVGDPTYWPDDSVDYVGSPSDPITAFGKNFGKLFIFKENSVYEKSFYWDSVSLKQSYPTSEVHVGIGCDMPNSVQLINNNLTWANSKGGVYTVATTNTNNERVIVPISQNINPDLLKNSLADLQAAVSVDDGFYYYLFVGTKVYLWDYNSTAFIDYSDILKAQNRLAWYIWTIPCALTTAFLYGGKVWGASATDNFLYAFDPLQSLDEGGAWFDAWMISKAFDNGLPQFKKQPYYYVFNMACAGVVEIEIQLIDEVDTCSILETIEGGDSEAMTSISLRQAMSWGKTYQVAVHRLNGDAGAFAISSYSIKSKIGKEV